MSILILTFYAPNNKENVFWHFIQLYQTISSTDFNSLFKHCEPSFLTFSPNVVVVIQSALVILYWLFSFRDHSPSPPFVTPTLHPASQFAFSFPRQICPGVNVLALRQKNLLHLLAALIKDVSKKYPLIIMNYSLNI